MAPPSVLASVTYRRVASPVFFFTLLRRRFATSHGLTGRFAAPPRRIPFGNRNCPRIIKIFSICCPPNGTKICQKRIYMLCYLVRFRSMVEIRWVVVFPIAAFRFLSVFPFLGWNFFVRVFVGCSFLTSMFDFSCGFGSSNSWRKGCLLMEF